MSALDLDAIEARASAAEPGPWKLWGMTVMHDHVGNSDYGDATDVAHTWDSRYDKPRTWNADFIAHARTDVPALVARVRELEAVVERVEAKEKSCRVLAASAIDPEVREWCTAFAADLRTVLDGTE